MTNWITFSLEMMKLGLESQAVMLQRLSRLHAGGPTAQREAAGMVTEKAMAAAIEIAAFNLALGSGKAPLDALQSTVKSYRRKVAANRRRLGRGPRKRRRSK